MSAEVALAVVGGGPAGLAAARGFRAAGGRGPVALITEEGRLPYERPPLSKASLRGAGAPEPVLLAEADELREAGIALVAARAVALAPADRTLRLSDGRELGYEACVLAPGADPIRLPVPGVDDPRVHTLRTLEHLRRLIDRLTPGAPVAVVGSGFIGCEAAASLRLRGHPVRLVTLEALPQEARLGREVGGRLQGWLEDAGVELHTGAAIEAIEHSAHGAEIHAGGERYPAEHVLMAAGMTPRMELPRSAGVREREGAIAADSSLRTSLPGLFAAGDAAHAEHAVAGRALRVEHWGDALAQGEAAGRTAAGQEAHWDTVPGFWSTIGERTLKYAAWGDGFDDTELIDHTGGGFTAWYRRGGRLVGVLTHEADADYETGGEQIAADA